VLSIDVDAKRVEEVAKFHGAILRAAATAQDGTTLLVGNEAGELVLMRVASSGETTWRKQRRERLIPADAILNDDGSFVVSGSGYDERRKQSTVWVGKFSPDGDLLRSLSVDGEFSNTCRRAGGGYATVFNSGSEIWLQVSDADLSTRPARRIFSGIKSLRPFRVAATPSGDLLVVGADDFKLSASRFSEDGNLIWTESFVDNSLVVEVVSYFDILYSTGSIAVAYTEATWNGQSSPKKMLRIAKLKSSNL
jgi:hypothetical protein